MLVYSKFQQGISEYTFSWKSGCGWGWSSVAYVEILEITAISVRGLTDPTVGNNDQSCYWRYLSFLCYETVLISTKLAHVFVHSKLQFFSMWRTVVLWHGNIIFQLSYRSTAWAMSDFFFRLSDNNALGSFFSLMEQFSRWNIYRQETFHHFTEKYPDIVSTDSDEETVLLLQNPQISER